MNKPLFDFVDYLEAKKTVDDRALNRMVLENMHRSLQKITDLQIVEIAAGIGTMFERLVEWNLLPNANYTMVDVNERYVLYAQQRIKDWAQRSGFCVNVYENRLTLEKEDMKFEVDFCVADAKEFLEQTHKKWDLVIAHAFLDLVNVETLLPVLFSALKPQGFFYFSINFDAETIFLPHIDKDFERRIIFDYHRVMDEQKTNGQKVSGTKVGRNLFSYLQNAGARIVASGSSDWVVFPKEGGYTDREDYFLRCILDTVSQTLRNQVDYDIDSWLATRYQQITDRKLVYIAHQLDFFGIA